MAQPATIQPSEVVTSEAPQSHLSGAEIAQPHQEFARALDNLGEGLEAAAIPLAERQAQEDVVRQKVTRNADGSINVEDSESAPLIFGAAGDAYHRAVLAGTIASYDNALSEAFADLHQKHPTDAATFKAASDSFLTSVVTNAPPMMKAAVQRAGLQLQAQHYGAIADRAATLDIENNKQSIVSQIDHLKDTAIGLARQDGGNTPELIETTRKLNAAYDALGSNPLFKTPKDQIDIEKNNTAALLQGEAVVARVDATFKRNGKADAQAELERDVLKNPNLREIDRTRLYTQGLARLQYLSGDAKAVVDANRQIVSEMERSLGDGKLSAEDPTVGMAIRRAVDIGDVEGAQRLTAAAAVQLHLRALHPLPDAVRAEALGVSPGGGTEPVNPSIPPEGRALLKRIGASESGNRYDVRYTPNGGTSFSNFADHPNVAEPITSGPEAGNVSTAAGYYQFTAPTWQAQKAKLGLHDFSPGAQDAAAWDLAQTTYKEKTGKDLLTTLRSGNTSDVLPALSGQWSSLPGGRQAGQRYLAPSLSGGPGFTAEDAQRNPFLLSAYVRSLAGDPEPRVQSAKQTAAAIGKTIDNGFLPSPSAVAEVNQAARLYPGKMSAVADEVNGRVAGMQIAQMPAEQRAQIAETYRAATAGPDVHQINIANAALQQISRQEQNMRDHPLVEAAARGWTQAPAPFDPTKPETIGPALLQRAALSARIGVLNHMPSPSVLDKDEVAQVRAMLDTTDPEAKAKMYRVIATLPEDIRGATLKKIGGDDVASMADAAAGSLIRSAPDVAISIFRGQAATKVDKKWDPEEQSKEKFADRLAEDLPATAFSLQARTDPIGPYATMTAMVKARYADLSAQSGTTKYSDDRLDQAVADVTGGLVTHNNRKVITPARGMDQRQFEAVLSKVTDRDLAGVTTLNGAPVTADYLRGTAQLESAGDGRYFVTLGRDPGRPIYAYRYANTEAPAKFVLDLRGRAPSLVPAESYVGVLGQPVAR